MPNTQTHTIKATDSFLAVLGKGNYSWDTVIFELINNSIQAAEDRDIDLCIDIHFLFNGEQKLSGLQIIDKSGGILLELFTNCVTPAKSMNTIITLNEHGMGLNVALEWLARGLAKYQIESYTSEGAFKLDERISFERDFNTTTIDNNQEAGLHIKITNIDGDIDLSWPDAPAHNLYKFWARLCAKYRHKHEKFSKMGRKFEINIHAKMGSKSKTIRNYSPVPPVLMNPNSADNTWITSFTLKEGDYEVRYNFGAAAVERENYTIPIGDNQIGQHIHPYRISSNNIGFDIIYQDVVLESMNMEMIPIGKDVAMHGGANWDAFSCLRGEIVIMQGGNSFYTKDGIDADKILTNLNHKAHRILAGKEPHPILKEKRNFINLIKRQKVKKYEIAPEKIVKYRCRQAFESADLEVSQEVNTEVGRIDMIVDGIIHEHKVNISTPDDVMQLLKYLLTKSDKDIKGGKLWAPSHLDSAVKMAELVNNLFKAASTNQRIELKNLPDTWKNPNFTDEEKKLL